MHLIGFGASIDDLLRDKPTAVEYRSARCSTRKRSRLIPENMYRSTGIISAIAGLLDRGCQKGRANNASFPELNRAFC